MCASTCASSVETLPDHTYQRTPRRISDTMTTDLVREFTPRIKSSGDCGTGFSVVAAWVVGVPVVALMAGFVPYCAYVFSISPIARARLARDWLNWYNALICWSLARDSASCAVITS